MIDFGLCWDFKVRSHRCTNEIQQEQEILLKNSEAGKKIRPNSRILSVTAQSRFFISLHAHYVYKAISSLLFFFF